MERSVLFLTVPAVEHVDLLEIRAYVLESLAAGVLILGPSVKWEVVALPELGAVVIASTPSAATARPVEPTPGPPDPAPDGGVQERPAFTGAGAKEKRLIHETLVGYRKTSGLGCLAYLATSANGLTEEMLRAALRGGKLPMETWRLIGKALDTMSEKPEGTHGET